MKTKVDNLKSLVKKLLVREPFSADGVGVFCPTITYKDDAAYYRISIDKDANSVHHLSLFVDPDRNNDMDGAFFDCELTEKEYMELKWAIEEWEKSLNNKSFEMFKDFVEQQESPMDKLLSD